MKEFSGEQRILLSESGKMEMARAGDGKVRSETRRASCRLSKRVTAGEFKAFKDRARKSGFQNAQEFLSAFVLGNTEQANFKKRDMTLVLGHLGKIGSNMNQIARHLNSGKLKDVGDAERAALKASIAAIDNLGTALREKLK